MTPRPQAKPWQPGPTHFELSVSDRPPLLFRHPTPFQAARLIAETHQMEQLAFADANREGERLQALGRDPTLQERAHHWKLRCVGELAPSGHVIHALWAHPEQVLDARADTYEQRGLDVVEEICADLGYTAEEVAAIGESLLLALVAIGAKGVDWDEVKRLRDFGRAEALLGSAAEASANSSSRTSDGASSETAEPSSTAPSPTRNESGTSLAG